MKKLIAIYVLTLLVGYSCRQSSTTIAKLRVTEGRAVYNESMVEQRDRVGAADIGDILEVVEYRDMQGTPWAKVRGFKPQPWWPYGETQTEFNAELKEEGWIITYGTEVIE